MNANHVFAAQYATYCLVVWIVNNTLVDVFWTCSVVSQWREPLGYCSELQCNCARYWAVVK